MLNFLWHKLLYYLCINNIIVPENRLLKFFISTKTFDSTIIVRPQTYFINSLPFTLVPFFTENLILLLELTNNVISIFHSCLDQPCFNFRFYNGIPYPVHAVTHVNVTASIVSCAAVLLWDNGQTYQLMLKMSWNINY